LPGSPGPQLDQDISRGSLSQVCYLGEGYMSFVDTLPLGRAWVLTAIFSGGAMTQNHAVVCFCFAPQWAAYIDWATY
jgi:hypothetical protein